MPRRRASGGREGGSQGLNGDSNTAQRRPTANDYQERRDPTDRDAPGVYIIGYRTGDGGTEPMDRAFRLFFPSDGPARRIREISSWPMSNSAVLLRLLVEITSSTGRQSQRESCLPHVTLAARRRQEIVLTRVFDAPRRLVFNAMTLPEMLGHWFGPEESRLEVCEVDLRRGGTFRYIWRTAWTAPSCD